MSEVSEGTVSLRTASVTPHMLDIDNMCPSSPQHIFTHEELVAIEEDPGDVAEDEHKDDADEDESQIDFLLH